MDRARFKKSDSRGSEASVPLTIQLVQGPLIDEGKRFASILVDGPSGTPILLIDELVSDKQKQSGIRSAVEYLTHESSDCGEGGAAPAAPAAQTFAHGMARTRAPYRRWRRER
jgi:hypothetical protein